MAGLIASSSMLELMVAWPPGAKRARRSPKQQQQQLKRVPIGGHRRSCRRGIRFQHSAVHALLRGSILPFRSRKGERKQLPKRVAVTSRAARASNGSGSADGSGARIASATDNCTLGRTRETEADSSEWAEGNGVVMAKSRKSVARKSDAKVTADSSASWARRAGAEPALDRDEELALSAAVQDMLGLEHQKDLLTRELGRAATMEEWASRCGISVFNIYARIGMGRAAKRKMIAANLPLVNAIAEQFRGKGLSHVELCQEGVLGLVRSTEKYDKSYNTKFSTYSFMWIWAKMSEGVKKLGDVLRMSRTVTEKSSSIIRQKEAFQSSHGRQPSLQELASVTGVNKATIQELKRMVRPVQSMDKPVPTRKGELEPEVEDPDITCIPWKLVMETELKKEVATAMHCLTPREQKVLEMRFGLNGKTPQGRAEVGQTLNLTYESIRLIEKKAVLNLRHLTKDGLRYYLTRTL